MINSKIFCPFERVVTLFTKWAVGKGVSLASFKIKGYNVSATLTPEKFGMDVNLGCPISVRDSLLSSKEFRIEYTLSDQEGSVLKKGDLVVKNQLYTDAPLPSYVMLDGKRVINGSVSTGSVCYPEALTTIAEGPKLQAFGGVISPSRPLYQYVFKSDVPKGNVDVEILGPGIMDSELSRAQVVIGNRKFSVTALDFELPEVAVEAVSAPLPSLETQTKPVALAFEVPSGTRHSFVFGQRAFVIDGKTLNFDIILFALKTLVFAQKELSVKEILTEAGLKVEGSTIIVPLFYDGESYYLSDSLRAFERKYYDANSLLYPYFSVLRSTGDSLVLSTRKGTAYLARSYHASSCYLFAVATALALADGGTIVDQLDYLIALADSDFMTIDINSKIEGPMKSVFVGNNTSRFTKDNPLKLDFPTRKYSTAVLYRRTSTAKEAENGYYVLQVQSGDKEHYIVVKATGGTLMCAYDSDRFDPIPNGTVINSPDKTLIAFDGEVTRLTSTERFADLGMGVLYG